MEVVKGELAMKLNAQPGEYASIHRALLAGLLSQVAQRKEQAEYLGANGTKIFIHPGSGQFKARPAWIVSAEQVETTKVYARNVARVEPAWIEKAAAHLVKRHHYDPHWERRASRAAVYERVTLFGLTLSTGRSVPFEQIDSKAARELFIRHALVHMEYDSRAPFLAHNLKLLKDTEYLQQKGRRVDLLGDESQLYEFFDARLPEGISTGAAFERWRREAESREPKLLWLTERDIAPGEAELDAARFPDHLSAGPLVVQLRYRFEPGNEDDGVSALVPLHVLNQLPEEAFEWLVPGLLDEKVEALVRSLPKNLRVHFVPVPDAVARVLPLLEPERGSLHAQLADALLRTAGVPVPRDAFREDLLPPHLRMNFVLLDDSDKVIARSRSLAALREKHAGSSQQHYAKQSQLTTGARSWVFGDLSERQEVSSGGRSQIGYPALVDEGETVGLRVFATPAEARISHERGCARLLTIGDGARPQTVAPRSRRQRAGRDRRIAPSPRIRLVNPDLLAGRDLRDDLLDRVVMTVFLEGQRATAQRRRVRGAHRRTGTVAESVCPRRKSRVRAGGARATGPYPDGAGEGRAAAAADIRAQITWLVAGRISSNYAGEPVGGVSPLPAGDRAAAGEAAPRSATRCAAGGRDRAARGALPRSGQDRTGPRSPLGEDEFRWQLEEFRVSLFAQQLGTRAPVSARRLGDAWVERERLPPG